MRKLQSHTRSRISNNRTGAVLTLGLIHASSMALTPAARAQTFRLLYTFTDSVDSATPEGTLLLHDGRLYGTSSSRNSAGLGTIYQVDIRTGRETVLHRFAGSPSDGNWPAAGLIGDAAGNLYGSTTGGGPNSWGTLFKLDAAGHYTLAHAFDFSDGQSPQARLIRDGQGNLYGTTYQGGISNSGTVFKLDTAGVFTTLYRFTGSPDGEWPHAALLLDKGNLYGTTTCGGSTGGAAYGCVNGFGTVFSLAPPASSGSAWVETVLYSFTGGADGASPNAELVADGRGNLYGTTVTGGNAAGNGVIFKFNLTTMEEQVLHTFTGVDGSGPTVNLVRTSGGTLYGTTVQGGAFNFGTVFKLGGSGALTTLHSFTAGTDGAFPEGGLVRDSGGHLYGTTAGSGITNNPYGTVFEITP